MKSKIGTDVLMTSYASILDFVLSEELVSTDIIKLLM